MPDKMTAIIIRCVPESMRKALKLKAMQQDKSMQSVVLELIQGYISEVPKCRKN